jgi:hypothetical protein
MISGMGFPSLLDNYLKNSIDEVNEIGSYDYLIIVLDSEEESIDFRINEVEKFIEKKKLKLNCELKIIVQHRCIETWLLGNRKVFTRQPSDKELSNFIKFYDVSTDDPELCPKYQGHSTTAAFHFKYLKKILEEKHISYSKKLPQGVTEEHYLNELKKRTADNHISSFKEFIDFCESINR